MENNPAGTRRKEGGVQSIELEIEVLRAEVQRAAMAKGEARAVFLADLERKIERIHRKYFLEAPSVADLQPGK